MTVAALIAKCALEGATLGTFVDLAAHGGALLIMNVQSSPQAKAVALGLQALQVNNILLGNDVNLYLNMLDNSIHILNSCKITLALADYKNNFSLTSAASSVFNYASKMLMWKASPAEGQTKSNPAPAPALEPARMPR